MFLTAVPAGAAAGPTVFVSIVPQKFFVQHIGGDHFDVEVMVQPGASPHTYEPKPSQMRKLAAARAYFTIGVALEDAWLDKISTINPGMKVVHTEAGIVRMKMVGDHPDGEGHDSDAQGEGRAHDGAEGLDPHIWLSPELVKVQAKTITDSLVELDPDREQKYRENYSRFIALVDELDARLRSILAGKTGMKFMVFHPSWGYFARSYGLTQVAVEIEGKSPKPASLKKLIDQARAQQIRVIFAQPQFSRKSAEMIAREIDGEVVLIDPLAEDWGANMVSVADTLSRALR
ncbi:MAG: zinc ABC transporter substrate-binding protein [Desulfofustis sp.]|jgi:zinc transport system substrate-binding protein|nr:zinc ABC transporter substrate-binding protein [Desulfofustis sp.]